MLPRHGKLCAPPAAMPSKLGLRKGIRSPPRLPPALGASGRSGTSFHNPTPPLTRLDLQASANLGPWTSVTC